jgi:hypothetical protein
MAGKESMVVADVVAATAGSCDLVAAYGDLGMGNSSGVGSAGKPVNGGETVEDMMQRLNLTSKEADPLILDDEEDADLPCPEWALIGKVLAPNTLHVNTIRAMVRPAWGNPKGLVVRPMGPNMFMVEFASGADKLRVAKGGPWHISKHAIC